MPVPSALGNGETRHPGRCRVCDADILFLSTCPACGAPADTAPTPDGALHRAGPGPVPATGSAQVVRLGDATRPRSRTPQAAGRAPARAAPASSGRPTRPPDEWTAAAPARTGGAKRLTAALGLVAVLAIGAGLVASGLSSRARQQGATPSLLAPRSFRAGGFPFTAALPSAPAASHNHLRLAAKGYVATVYSSASDGVTVSIGVYPFPVGSPAGFHLRSFVSAFLTKSAQHGTLSMARTTRFDGVKAVRLAGVGGRTGGIGMVVLDGHVAYEVLVLGPSSLAVPLFHEVMAHFRIAHPSLGFGL